MTKDQKTVSFGMIFAVLFIILYVPIGYNYFPFSIPELPSAGERLAYAIKYDFFAGIMLLAGVVCVAQQRFFSPEGMDGSRPPEGSSLEINLRYLQNTLDQYFLLVIGHLGLSLVISHSALKVIPVMVSLFIIARIAFWVGYHCKLFSRAFGFASTFYPNVAVFIYVLYRLI